jgi:hypothetical protein
MAKDLLPWRAQEGRATRDIFLSRTVREPFEMSWRMKLTDRRVAQLPVPTRGAYLVRDAERRSFFLVVGRYTKTYTVQADVREGGKRKSVRAAIPQWA